MADHHSCNFVLRPSFPLHMKQTIERRSSLKLDSSFLETYNYVEGFMLFSLTMCLYAVQLALTGPMMQTNSNGKATCQKLKRVQRPALTAEAPFELGGCMTSPSTTTVAKSNSNCSCKNDSPQPHLQPSLINLLRGPAAAQAS